MNPIAKLFDPNNLADVKAAKKKLQKAEEEAQQAERAAQALEQEYDALSSRVSELEKVHNILVDNKAELQKRLNSIQTLKGCAWRNESNATLGFHVHNEILAQRCGIIESIYTRAAALRDALEDADHYIAESETELSDAKTELKEFLSRHKK
ncbi:hypothetical protein [Cerasicoccus fimbriatus]|uniref:hypothetical protein n=1 Tax=Cerasicoccus fimbriatus TaxID=3014554 RepID=UPI0022B3975B|nr:hypothetical protein [Cerasicoccus sp. TK19100]